VFDRFYRGEVNEEAGSGLGLSIVKRIADAHGATITLDAPREGTGLVVRVTFP
jgi:signal transduction histidine kinase